MLEVRVVQISEDSDARRSPVVAITCLCVIRKCWEFSHVTFVLHPQLINLVLRVIWPEQPQPLEDNVSQLDASRNMLALSLGLPSTSSQLSFNTRFVTPRSSASHEEHSARLLSSDVEVVSSRSFEGLPH